MQSLALSTLYSSSCLSGGGRACGRARNEGPSFLLLVFPVTLNPFNLTIQNRNKAWPISVKPPWLTPSCDLCKQREEQNVGILY